MIKENRVTDKQVKPVVLMKTFVAEKQVIIAVQQPTAQNEFSNKDE